MIREPELIAQFTYLERRVLLTWIEDGVIAPQRDEQGYLFDQVDEARVALACDLHYRMGLEHAKRNQQGKQASECSAGRHRSEGSLWSPARDSIS